MLLVLFSMILTLPMTLMTTIPTKIWIFDVIIVPHVEEIPLWQTFASSINALQFGIPSTMS